MNIRTKVLLIMAASSFGLILITFGSVYWIMHQRALRNDYDHVHTTLAQVNDVFQARLEDLGTTTADYSSWDDTCTFMEKVNQDFINSNFGMESFRNIHVNWALFLDPSGKLVLFTGYDLVSSKPADPPKELLSLAGPQSPLAGVDTNFKKVGLLATDSGLVMIAARPILKSNLEGPVRGVLLFARQLDSTIIQELSADLHLPIKIVSRAIAVNEASIAGMEKSADGYRYSIFFQDDQLLNGHITFPDIYGQPVLQLQVDLPRTFYRQIVDSVGLLLLTLLLVNLIVNLMIVALLDRLILKRLNKLRDTVLSITGTNHLKSRVPELGADEIGELSKSINTMLADLEQEVENRAAVEESLRIAENRYRSVSEASDHLVYEYDLAKRQIEYIGSIQGITGYNPETFQKAGFDGWKDKIHPEDQPEVIRRLEECIRTGSAFHAEYRFRKADGEWMHIEDVGTITQSHKNKPIMMVGAMKDISDRVRAREERDNLERERHQLQKMESLGRLAGGVAHDFNNLLTSIMGNLQMVIMDFPDTHPHFSSLEEAFASAQSASALTAQLLAFSRKKFVEPKNTDLNELISTMHKMLVRLIRENVRLLLSLDARNLVKIDSGQMGQVIINLAVNARDAMPVGGVLTIRTSDIHLDTNRVFTTGKANVGDYVLLSVIDNGRGMDESTMKHIFEPFFTTKPKDKGTGLGLATIYGIISQCGGYIDVQSWPGKGTHFQIYLPAIYGEVTAKPSPVKTVEMPKGKETIVLVEDEPSVRKLASTILRNLDYTVLEYKSGDDLLLDLHKIGHFHLLLTDIIMPGINGRILASRVAEEIPEVRILFTSGYTDDVLTFHEAEESINFLTKPYTPVTLANKVRSVLTSPQNLFL